jgi:mannose-6-phosphate isomerase-like protein (cupin superfamily)
LTAPASGSGEWARSIAKEERWSRMTAARVQDAGQARSMDLGGFGVAFRLFGRETGGAFSAVEHPIDPGVLAAPPHIHHNEDEYFYILDGEVTLLIADETVVARSGTIAFVPKGAVHTFWNHSDEPARLLEMFTPAGFEAYFEELPSLFGPNGPDLVALEALSRRYGMEAFPERIPSLMEAHALRPPA